MARLGFWISDHWAVRNLYHMATGAGAGWLDDSSDFHLVWSCDTANIFILLRRSEELVATFELTSGKMHWLPKEDTRQQKEACQHVHAPETPTVEFCMSTVTQIVTLIMNPEPAPHPRCPKLFAAISARSLLPPDRSGYLLHSVLPWSTQTTFDALDEKLAIALQATVGFLS